MPSKTTFDAKAISGDLAKGVNAWLNMLTLSLQKRIRKKLLKAGTGRMYGSHRASAPGEPPATKSGNLVNSWVAARKMGPNRVHNSIRIKLTPTNVGSSAKYAWVLEFGHQYATHKLKARPYIRPAIALLEKGGRAQRIMNDQIQRGINLANRRT